MRFAIMGVGAIGGMFGRRLERAGHETVYIARNQTRKHLRYNGLEVIDDTDGTRVTTPVRVVGTEDLAAIREQEPPFDHVVLCVKTWQVQDACTQIRALVSERTGVLTLQNGVEAPGQVESILGVGHTIAGTAKVLCDMIGPGVIRIAEFPHHLAVGEFDGARSDRVEALAAALSTGGIDTVVAEDIQRSLWEKFMFLVSYGGIGAVSRMPLGVMRREPETRAMLDAAIREIHSVGCALGVNLPDEQPEELLAFLDRAPADATASMMRDILAGKPSELREQNGAVVRLGRKAGVSTPVHEFIWSVLEPSERRARGEIDEGRFA